MLERIDGPSAEPLTLSEAKAFLRIDGDAEDAVVAALITAARQWVESETRRILMLQTWRLTRDAWPPSGLIPVPLAPVRAVRAAHLVAPDGSTQDVPLDLFTLGGARLPPLIAMDPARAPAPLRRVGGILLELEMGYGASAAQVPADLLQAVRQLTAFLHENRDAPGDQSRLPESLFALLRPYRAVRL
ncbi:head-tail connector protein [Xanthobacter sp. DSM 24535]|uniref:head-tail connector protein n=1 Tax=Roseixanthobacter psychrophilus TaxID=3119917 RepID=UPI0037262FAD